MTGVDLTEGNGISISESNTNSGNYTGTITLNSDGTTLSGMEQLLGLSESNLTGDVTGNADTATKID